MPVEVMLRPQAEGSGNFQPLPIWLPGQPRSADWPSNIHGPKEVKANNIDWRTLFDSTLCPHAGSNVGHE